MNRLPFYILTFVFLMLLTFDYTPLVNPVSHIYGDAVHYRAMAVSPLDNDAIRPFKYRILLPWAVHGLSEIGVNIDAAFFVFTFLSLLLSSWVLCSILREGYVDEQFAQLGGFLFLSTFWLSMFMLSDFWILDPLTNLCLLVGIWCILRHKFGWLMVLMVGGAFLKEHLMILLVFAYFWGNFGWLRLALLTAIPLVIHIYLHWVLGYSGHHADTIVAAVGFYSDVPMVWKVFNFLWIPALPVFAYCKWFRNLVLTLIVIALGGRMIAACIPRIVAWVFMVPVFMAALIQLQRLQKRIPWPLQSYYPFVIFIVYFWWQTHTLWV